MSGGRFNNQPAANDMTEAERLAQEFAAIDSNGDGKVDREEMNTYLDQLGIDEEHRI